MKARTDQWYPYLDALRIVLSGAVVLYHYFWHGALGGGMNINATPIDQFAFFSYAVQLFFIISGFVIAGSMGNKTGLEFFIARAVRLGPTLIVCGTITLMVVKSAATTPPVEAPFLGYIYTITLIPLIRELGIDPSLWSITYELRFYSMAALLLWIWRSHAEASLLWLVAALDLIPLVGGLMIDARMLSTNTGFKIYGCFFAMGMVIQAVHQRKRASPLMIFIFLMLFISCSIRTNQDFVKIHSALEIAGNFSALDHTGFYLNFFGIVTLIACLSMKSPKNANFISILRVLGRASFPLYALHQSVGFWLINILNTQLTIDARVFVTVLMLLVSIGISEAIEPSVRGVYARLIRRMASTASSMR